MRVMHKLPRQTHKYFIEPLSNCQHLKFVLLKRFLKFKEQVMRCPKPLMKTMFNLFEYNCNTTTGKNMRNIMLLCDKNSIIDLNSSDIDLLTYEPVPKDDEWKISVAEEILSITEDQAILPGFNNNEVNALLYDICVS